MLSVKNLQGELEELLMDSTISETRKRRVMDVMDRLSIDQLRKLIVVLQKEREALLKVLRKKKRLDLQYDMLKRRFLG